jgi:hypothetical protein
MLQSAGSLPGGAASLDTGAGPAGALVPISTALAAGWGRDTGGNRYAGGIAPPVLETFIASAP